MAGMKLAVPVNNLTSCVTPRNEESVPGGAGDVVVPVVGAGSDGNPFGLKVGQVEVSLTVTTNFWP